jgi:hypothetical protein
MKKIYNYHFRKKSGVLFDSFDMHETYFAGESQFDTKGVNINKVNTVDIQSKSFYRYPKLDLPRMKVDLLKEKYDIFITRNKDTADYKVVSLKYLSNLATYSWNSLYVVSDVIKSYKALSPGIIETNTKNNFISELELYDQDDLVSIKAQHSYSQAGMDSCHPGRIYSSHYYLDKAGYDEIVEITSSSNVILDSNLNEIIYEGLHKLTQEEYSNARKMIKSNDLENRALALELLSNCNLTESFDYVSLLYYFYYDYLKDARNWNSINVKTLKVSLKEFSPYTQTRSGHYYNTYLMKLIESNHFTEFAFKECAGYAFHNVVKSHMGLSDDSVFTINLDAIKVNPKYIDKLKREANFFNSELEKQLITI